MKVITTSTGSRGYPYGRTLMVEMSALEFEAVTALISEWEDLRAEVREHRDRAAVLTGERNQQRTRAEAAEAELRELRKEGGQ